MDSHLQVSCDVQADDGQGQSVHRKGEARILKRNVSLHFVGRIYIKGFRIAGTLIYHLDA